MRHSGQDSRCGSARIARLPVLLLLISAAACLAVVAGRGAVASEITASKSEVTGVRLGRHADFLRLVFDLTARPEFSARATGARTFQVILPKSSLPPEGHRALAADPLAPDLILRPARNDGGPLRFGVASRFDAFIRRTFVLPPKTGGMGLWRLVLDVVPRPGVRSPAPSHAETASTHALLPAPHGLADIEPVGPSAPAPVRALRADRPTPPPPAALPAQVEVSWARASRILRELQERQAPDADADLPPQLVLAPKYRRPMVPLR